MTLSQYPFAPKPNAYDVGSKELSELKVGDIVRVQHGLTKKWNLIAEVLEIRPRGRSYLVKTESGRLYWRNRRYLKLYAPPIGVAKDIPESQEEVKQPRRSKRQKKAPGSSLLLLLTQTPNYIICVSSPAPQTLILFFPYVHLFNSCSSKTLLCTSLFEYLSPCSLHSVCQSQEGHPNLCQTIWSSFGE
ncbi:Transposon Tf2-6 polyprotein [Caligus rogercresseyi]|uniref:Transposon Tf2-6 polyprotein n=1 Tax=Caligus rogercresseyi TaxID=217165 RepID=A0A7T8KK55_CALRO|nr:Transposon Tf2-6 polyprotein [Caligus rogercresseyi]